MKFNKRVVGLLVIVFISILMNSIVYRIWSSSIAWGDFRFHLEFVLDIKNHFSSILDVPHFLYHVAVLFITYLIPPLSIGQAGSIVVILNLIAVAILVYYIVMQSSPDMSHGYVVFFVLSLTIISPITIFTWINRDMYAGYISPNVYHNPTTNALKPWALGLSLLAVQPFLPKEKRQLKRNLLGIALVVMVAVIGGLAKPNYNIVLLPSLVLFTLYSTYIRHIHVDILFIAFAFIAPITIVILAQYAITYLSDSSVTGGGGVSLGLFVVMRMHTAWYWILPKLLLSIVFPLLVYFNYYPNARSDIYLNFSWLAFAIGLGYTYFFHETVRTQDGNFMWSGSITSFILFVATTLFFIKQNANLFRDYRVWTNWSPRFKLEMAVFGLHVLCGIANLANYTLKNYVG